nr:MAG TPA: hypothetical protein [Caudoviricetes sp.]
MANIYAETYLMLMLLQNLQRAYMCQILIRSMRSLNIL